MPESKNTAKTPLHGISLRLALFEVGDGELVVFELGDADMVLFWTDVGVVDPPRGMPMLGLEVDSDDGDIELLLLGGVELLVLDVVVAVVNGCVKPIILAIRPPMPADGVVPVEMAVVVVCPTPPLVYASVS